GPPSLGIKPAARIAISSLPDARPLCYAFLFPRHMTGTSERTFPMGARRIRREQRHQDMLDSHRRNGVRKVKERARRDARMRDILQQGQLPYTPPVMSWLSAKLGEPSKAITQDDVKKLLV